VVAEERTVSAVACQLDDRRPRGHDVSAERRGIGIEQLAQAVGTHPRADLVGSEAAAARAEPPRPRGRARARGLPPIEPHFC
jgi:hypothetical protein